MLHNSKLNKVFNVDCFNLAAIEAWEKIGELSPTETQIRAIEGVLKQGCQHKYSSRKIKYKNKKKDLLTSKGKNTLLEGITM